ncbi:hypothetical protein Tco_1235595 [Tanacetum coccineum]
MGTFRETLAEGNDGALHLGPEQPRVYYDLSLEDKERYNADIRATNILLQGLPKDIYLLINHYTDAIDIWDNVKMLLEGSELTKEDRPAGYGGAQNRVGNANPGQARQDLALNVDNVFQVDDCDAFDFDVVEAPTAHTMFMANLSSIDPVYDEAGPSYDLEILFEVHDHDHYQDVVCEHHEEHEMHDNVQPTYVVDSHANYTSDSNMISYDQYVKDNAVPVIQSNVSSVPDDAYMMIFNDMNELYAQSVSDTTRNIVVDKSLTAKIETYKEQVKLYERRARFELTEREQKIDAQLRIVITDRNIKEENLKKELHYVKMKLASTINHNKSMALTKEIKEMKYIFEELEAEVDQNVVNSKHDEIEQKNLLIANDNLIVDCLSTEVFYNAHTIVQTRCLQLEAKLYKLRDKVQKDNHTELVKHFSNLEVNHLNLQLKYQNLKESFGNNTYPTAHNTPDFDSVFVIEKMKASIQGKDNAIKKLRTQISQLKDTRSEADRTLDFRTLYF